MAIKLFTDDQKTVTTAGTRVQITSTSTPCTTIIIQADPTNTGAVYIGDSLVSSTRATSALAAGSSITITADMSGNRGGDELDLSDIWIDAASNGQKAYVSYIKRRN